MLLPAAVVVGAQCGQKRTACCDATPSTADGSFIDKTLVDLHTMRAPKPTIKPTLRSCDCMFTRVRVRLKKIGNLETMHDSDLPTVLRISSPIIFKRTRMINRESDYVIINCACERTASCMMSHVE